MLTAVLLAQSLSWVPVAPGTFTVDAFFDDWSEVRPTPVDRVARGSLLGPDDCVPRAGLAISGDRLFVAVEVRDDLLQRGSAQFGDGLELAYASATGKGTLRLQVVLGELEGERPARAEVRGRPVKDVQVAGTQRKDGWAVEFSVPLTRLPGVRDGEFGLALVVRDADQDPTAPDAWLTSAPLGPDGLPELRNLRFEPTAGLYAQYVSELGQAPEVLTQTRGDLAGTPDAEEVVVNTQDLVVAGRGLPDGAVYYLFRHGWPAGTRITRLDLMELDGRPGRELLLEREVPADGVRVQILEIYGVRDGVLLRRFAQKLGEVFTDRGGASARSTFRILPAKGRGPRTFEVTVARLEGLDEATYPPETPGARPYQPLPLPWQVERAQRFALEGEVWERQAP